jgi:hypothetical protein
LNLLLNAEQAMKYAVRALSITATAEPDCGAQLIRWGQRSRIEPANLRRVFDPFFTTRGSVRTGLAEHRLRIVRDHGGQIWVESEMSRRTSFFVRLPGACRGRGRRIAGGAAGGARRRGVSRFFGAVFSGGAAAFGSSANTREALESGRGQVGLRRSIRPSSRPIHRAGGGRAPLRGRAR